MVSASCAGSAGLTAAAGALDAGRPFGLPDDAFEQRRPARGQITKSEVRAVSLYALGLKPDSTLWDIGAGTGSVAVEAARIAHRGQIYAIDQDADSADLLRRNVARYGDGRVRVIIGTAPEALAELPDPDAVFIGGGGGAIAAIVRAAIARLRPAGRLAANFAAPERANATYRILQEAEMSPELDYGNGVAGGANCPTGRCAWKR